MNQYSERRNKILNSMEGNCAFVFFSGKAPMRSQDEAYDFYVDRNFYYLTGLDKEDMVLVMYKLDGMVRQSLFILPYDELLAKWVGGRMMFRIAEQIAREEGCLALATGESVGQVASQTLESIACINEVISMPVLRPLICVDKVDIIDLARKIGTYETSILPYEDCCTIFDPKNPVTKPTSKKASFYESRFDYASMVEECVKNCTEITVHPAEAEDYL